MDVRARALFEEFVSSSLRVPFIVVSHDRDFLDRFTNQTMFLRDRRLYQFGSPYSRSREELIYQDIAAMEARQAEEKELRRLRSSAKRLALWGDRNNENAARASKNMRKRIDRLEDSRTFVSNDESGNLRISTEQMKADQVVRIEQVTIKTPDGTELFEIDELTLRPGDRVALLGANGVGKSTLLRAIDSNHRRFSQQVDWDYSFRFNPSATIGFFDQDLSALDANITIEGAMIEHIRGVNRQTIVNKLIKSGFPYEQQSLKVSALSGGERARLQLLILQETQHSFLLLDEPTSHLDIMGVEDLEVQLVDSGATCLFTSHDRRFIENVANRILLVRNGRIVEINSLDEFYTGLEP
jgi:ATPase subunit of ABC transporter with duplicated ATPase domains